MHYFPPDPNESAFDLDTFKLSGVFFFLLPPSTKDVCVETELRGSRGRRLLPCGTHHPSQLSRVAEAGREAMFPNSGVFNFSPVCFF